MAVLDPTMFGGVHDSNVGLLAPFTRQPQQPQQMGITPDMLLALGAGIAGGNTWGQGIGQGLQGALGVKQFAQRQQTNQDELALRQQMMRRQIENSGPASVQEFQFAVRNGFKGDFQTWLKVKGAADGSAGGGYGLNPVYGVNEQGQPVIMQLGKGGQAVQTALPPGVTLSKEPIKLDAGTHFVLLDPISRQQVGMIPKNNQQAASDTALGTVQGRTQGEAQAALPRVEAQATDMLNVIDGILGDPALKGSTGWNAWRQKVPSSDAFRFGERVKQLEGQAFLQAYNELKGGGQITEIEGQKATAAMGRLSTSQNPKDYEEALRELRGVIARGMEKKRAAAGVRANSPRGANEIPTGVDPETWRFMTPEERALWQ
jgi:hypothetical protein